MSTGPKSAKRRSFHIYFEMMSNLLEPSMILPISDHSSNVPLKGDKKRPSKTSRR